MAQRNRRQFLEESMLAAAATAANAASPAPLLGAPIPVSRSVNAQIGVAVMGVRGRGNSHLGFFASRRDARLLYVCDVDRHVGRLRAGQAGKRQGSEAPRWVEDIRHVLDDPRVDAVTIATPNHWHALAAIWAMQAGKDVYVEMPVSQNVAEGRRMVEAARRYRRVCQSGLQARSNPGMLAAIAFLHAGGIGTVQVARATCYRTRRRPGKPGSYPIPPQVNYDLWLGPAPAAPLTRKRLHYDWRWQSPYGNGDLGDQAIHLLDLARWGLQAPTMPDLAFSYIIRDAPSRSDIDRLKTRQVTCHRLGSQTLVLQLCDLSMRSRRGVHNSVLFEGTDGYLVLTSYHSATAFDPDGRAVRHFHGGGGCEPHFSNFMQAVLGRACHSLHADIEQGHVSSAWMHAANISADTGSTLPLANVEHRCPDHRLLPLSLAWQPLEQQLADHPMDREAIQVQLGSPLACDPTVERFVADQRANAMLARPYRPPFILRETLHGTERI